MAVVTFDVDAFRAAYPHFSDLSDGQLENFFDMACLYLDNTDSSPVSDVKERRTLLFMLVCHLATLSQRGSGITGALSSASEGSVSASYSVPDWGSAKWYAQTQCGLSFYAATRKYRFGGRWYAYAES